MKKLSTLLIALFTSIVFSGTLAAQVIYDVLEHSWRGASVISSNVTKEGKIYLNQTLNLTINGTTFSGTGTSTMKMDGNSYTCVTKVSGNIYGSSNSIYIKDDYNTRADALPHGLQWCKGWGTLQLYTNANKSGYYLLKGSITDECGGTSDFEIGDD